MADRTLEHRRTCRYLAVRSCTPNPRKGNASEPIERAHRNGVVLRTDKDLVGFVIAEWDVSLTRGHQA